MKIPLLAAFALSLIGCAGVTRQEMLKETEGFKLPAESEKEAGKARIYVARPSGVGALIRFNVFLDDTKQDSLEAGFTRGSQHIYFNVGPGRHKLLSVAENTAECELDLKADSTYFLRQDATMGIIMARNQLVQVDSVEGKYDVKKTSLGTIKRKSFP